MSNEPTDVMIGAYLDMGPAKADYQAVVDSGAKIEGAVSHALKKAVGEAEGKRVAALKKALAEAQEKMKG